VALLFADLDSFKAVNDHFGHDAGDVVLKTVATRWLGCVRSTDTIARLGGDEFAIVLGDLADAQEAAAIAAKLVAALQVPIALPKGLSCRVGTSAGIAIYPHNAREMDSLLHAADQAMYDCKAAGRNTFGYSMAIASEALASDHWVAFTESHLVGVAEIDAQHRQLVRMVNEINFEMSVNAPDATIRPRFEALIQFTLHHFQTEQSLMALHRYPDTQAHVSEHAQLVTELQQIVQMRGREGDLLVLQRIKDWLITHMQSADRALGQYLNQAGVR
jgi:diguanylate cyclase (GGDEF)-like protein/hemerythrin-like metal-binding protein